MLFYIVIGTAFLLGFLFSWAFLADSEPAIVRKYGKRELSVEGGAYLDIPVGDVVKTEKKDKSLKSLVKKVDRFKKRNQEFGQPELS